MFFGVYLQYKILNFSAKLQAGASYINNNQGDNMGTTALIRAQNVDITQQMATFASKFVLFAIMDIRHLKRIITLTTIHLIVLTFCFLTGCRSGNDNGMAWNTGSPDLDRLLDRADFYEHPDHVDPDSIDKSIELLQKESGRHHNKAAKATALYTASRIAINNDEYEDAYALDSTALTVADSSATPYLYARIKLDMAGLTLKPQDRAEKYFELLPFFVEQRDSLRVLYILIGITRAYSHVWDDITQLEALQDAKRFVPDSMNTMKATIDFNILSLKRSESDSYIQFLDSLRHQRQLMENVTAIGVITFTDLYRLTGDTAALDTATYYYDKMIQINPYHPSRVIYSTYKLRYWRNRNNPDSTAAFAAVLNDYLTPDAIYRSEIIKELIPYYKDLGDYAKVDSLIKCQEADSVALAAYNEAGKMSRIKSTNDMDRLRTTLILKSDKRAYWITAICVIALIALIATLFISLLHRRRNKMARKKLEQELHHANHKLVATSLRAAQKEEALNQVLTELTDGSQNDDNVDKLANAQQHIRIALSGQEDWECFETAFTSIRPGFVENLLQHHPRLTRNERRLCCLLSMDLDTKHIARIMMIQPDSVKKSRQRLRAKLGMDRNETFTDFLANY